MNLRKDYKKRMTGRFWLLLKARCKFNKMYKRRRELFEMGKPECNLNLPEDHIYWFFNCSEEVCDKLDYVSCVYGDKNFRNKVGFNYDTASPKQKKKQARLWLIKRNPLWNRILREGIELVGNNRKLIKIITSTGGASEWNWRDKSDPGYQCIIFKTENGIKTFRYSYTIPLSKINPIHLIGRLLGYRYRNVMRGAGNSRYIYKNRWFKKLTT